MEANSRISEKAQTIALLFTPTSHTFEIEVFSRANEWWNYQFFKANASLFFVSFFTILLTQ